MRKSEERADYIVDLFIQTGDVDDFLTNFSGAVYDLGKYSELPRHYFTERVKQRLRTAFIGGDRLYKKIVARYLEKELEK